MRREASCSCDNADPAKAGPMILELAKQYDGKDRFYLLRRRHRRRPHDQKRREVILADFDKTFPELNDKIAGLLWELRPPGVLADAGKAPGGRQIARRPAQCGRRYARQLRREAGAAQALLQALAAETSADVRARLSSGPESQHRRQVELPGPEPGAEPGRRQAARTIRKPKSPGSGWWSWRDKDDFEAKVLSLAADAKQAAEVRLAALRALGIFRGREASQGIHEHLHQGKTPALRLEALNCPGPSRHARCPRHPALRRAGQGEPAGGTTSSRRRHRQHLQRRGIPRSKPMRPRNLPDDLTADLARLLRNSTFKDVKKPGRAGASRAAQARSQEAAQHPGPPGPQGQRRARQVDHGENAQERRRLPQVPHDQQGRRQRRPRTCPSSAPRPAGRICSNRFSIRAGPSPTSTSSGWWKPRRAKSSTASWPRRRRIICCSATSTPRSTRSPRRTCKSKAKSPKSIMPDNLLLFLSEDELLDVVEYLFSLKSPPVVPVSWRRDEVIDPQLTQLEKAFVLFAR